MKWTEGKNPYLLHCFTRASRVGLLIRLYVRPVLPQLKCFLSSSQLETVISVELTIRILIASDAMCCIKKSSCFSTTESTTSTGLLRSNRPIVSHDTGDRTLKKECTKVIHDEAITVDASDWIRRLNPTSLPSTVSVNELSNGNWTVRTAINWHIVHPASGGPSVDCSSEYASRSFIP